MLLCFNFIWSLVLVVSYIISCVFSKHFSNLLNFISILLMFISQLIHCGSWHTWVGSTSSTIKTAHHQIAVIVILILMIYYVTLPHLIIWVLLVVAIIPSLSVLLLFFSTWIFSLFRFWDIFGEFIGSVSGGSFFHWLFGLRRFPTV